jgi:hypothetical protein
MSKETLPGVLTMSLLVSAARHIGWTPRLYVGKTAKQIVSVSADDLVTRVHVVYRQLRSIGCCLLFFLLFPIHTGAGPDVREGCRTCRAAWLGKSHRRCHARTDTASTRLFCLQGSALRWGPTKQSFSRMYLSGQWPLPPPRSNHEQLT